MGRMLAFVESLREVGDRYLLVWLLPEMPQGTRWLNVLKALVCYQLVDPGSEWRLHRHWCGHSAMSHVLSRYTQPDSDLRLLLPQLQLALPEQPAPKIHPSRARVSRARNGLTVRQAERTGLECRPLLPRPNSINHLSSHYMPSWRSRAMSGQVRACRCIVSAVARVLPILDQPAPSD